MPLLLEELGWPDVEEYLQQDNRLLLVVGSTEQHGRHLAFGTDMWVPWEIACRVSDRTGILVAPPVNYGMSLHHLGFPGSLSLRPRTLSDVILDLMESAYQHGFRRILVLNGHGGNIAPIQVAAVEAMHERHGLEIRAGNWWREPAVARVLAEASPAEAIGHADSGETSVILAIRPDVVRMERSAHSPGAPSPGILSTQTFRDYFPHGVIGGDPRLASAAVGDLALETAVCVYQELLEKWT